MRSWTSWPSRAIWQVSAALAVPQIALHLGTRFAADNYWDLYVYVQAMDLPDPWTKSGLGFVYPPVAADFFRLFGTHLFEALLIAYVAAVAWLVRECASAIRCHRGPIALVTCGLGGLGVITLRSGNIAILLHACVLAQCLRISRREGRGVSALTLFSAAAGLVKPPFVIFGLLAVAIRQRQPQARRALVVLACAWIAVGAVWVAYWSFRNAEMLAFARALSAQTLDSEDLGIGVVPLVLDAGMEAASALTAHAAAWVACAATAVWIIARLRRLAVEAVDAAAPLIAYSVLTLATPRLQPYDLAPALLSLLTAGSMLRLPSPWALGVLGGVALNAVRPAIEYLAPHPAAFPPWTWSEGTLQLLGYVCVFAGFAIAACRTQGLAGRCER